MDFDDTAREWTELLRDATYASFAKQHVGLILQLAVTLARAQVRATADCFERRAQGRSRTLVTDLVEQDLESAIDHDAIRAHCTTQEVRLYPLVTVYMYLIDGLKHVLLLYKQDEHVLLSCAFVIKRLLNVVVRDRMRFLLPEHQLPQRDESSASQRESLAQQQALLMKIPSDFREAFVETLRVKCVSLPLSRLTSSRPLRFLTLWLMTATHVALCMYVRTAGTRSTMQRTRPSCRFLGSRTCSGASWCLRCGHHHSVTDAECVDQVHCVPWGRIADTDE